MPEYERIALTWDRITHDCASFARKLHDEGIITPDTRGIITLARGGMAVAQLLGYYLDIRRIETISVISYDDTQKVEQKLSGNPSQDIGNGDGWIVVDDLVDTGGSFRFVKNILPNARYVALYHKPQGLPDADCTLTAFAQDAWLDFPWEVQKITA